MAVTCDRIQASSIGVLANGMFFLDLLQDVVVLPRLADGSTGLVTDPPTGSDMALACCLM